MVYKKLKRSARTDIYTRTRILNLLRFIGIKQFSRTIFSAKNIVLFESFIIFWWKPGLKTYQPQTFSYIVTTRNVVCQLMIPMYDIVVMIYDLFIYVSIANSRLMLRELS